MKRRGTKSLTHKSAKADFYDNHSPIMHQGDLANVTYLNANGTALDRERHLDHVKFL